jgi:3-hydroxyisobutyrate dehydrogenase-like beta-hydroxyacid dehydrogenase
MGAAMARHLLDARTPVSVYDPVAEATAPLVARGAVAGESASDVAARCDVVLVVVVDDAQVRQVVADCLRGARAGTIVAICASVRPDTCRELAADAERSGVAVIDAALIRGERGAEEGQLVLYCGGPQETVDAVARACEPFLEAAVRVGDVGAGQIAKTANNILLWACIRADVEALRLARALGVEPGKLREAMAHGSGANRPLAEWGKHRLRWPQKDLEVALAVAADAGLDLPLVAELPRLMDELTVDDLRELL